MNKLRIALLSSLLAVVGCLGLRNAAVSQTGGCTGAPTYSCANTSLDVLQATSVPNMGSELGVNTVGTDPVFGATIVRATDALICRGNNFSQFAGIGGSATVNTWNSDETALFLEDSGNSGCVLSFDKALQKFSTCATNLPSGGDFDSTNPKLLYTLSNSKVVTYDLTDCAAPVVSTLFDFASDPNCGVPSSVLWSDFAGVSAGNVKTFAAAFSSAGQGSGTQTSVYRVGSGCRVWHTDTGLVDGSWGTKGTIAVTDRFFVHNVKLSPDGATLVVNRSGCIGTCTGAPYIWPVAGTAASTCVAPTGGPCSGHWVPGNKHFVHNGSGIPWHQGQWSSRPYSDMSALTQLIDPFPTVNAPVAPFDAHASWPKSGTDDSFPIFITTITPVGTGFTSPWANEVIAVSTTPDKVKRFAHTNNRGTSGYFSCANAIGAVSRGGNYFMFTSDWNGTLGQDKFGKDRCDVFVVDLRSARSQ